MIIKESCTAVLINRLNNVHNNLENPIATRAFFAVRMPVELIANLIDTIFALGNFLTTSIPCIDFQRAYISMLRDVDSTTIMISNLFFNILRIFNPNASLTKYLKEYSASEQVRKRETGFKQPLISSKGDGLLTSFVKNKLRSQAKNCNYRIQARLTYALMLVACVITRTADAAISVVATALTLLTLGKFDTLNNVTYRSLQFTGVLEDILFSIVKIFKPDAGKGKEVRI